MAKCCRFEQMKSNHHRNYQIKYGMLFNKQVPDVWMAIFGPNRSRCITDSAALAATIHLWNETTTTAKLEILKWVLMLLTDRLTWTGYALLLPGKMSFFDAAPQRIAWLFHVGEALRDEGALKMNSFSSESIVHDINRSRLNCAPFPMHTNSWCYRSMFMNFLCVVVFCFEFSLRSKMKFINIIGLD